MPTPVTGTYLPDYAPTIWSKDTIDAREKRIVIAPNVERYDDEVKSFGDTITLPTFASGVVKKKTAGTAIAWTAVTEGAKTISINQQAYDNDLIEDLIATQSKYNLRSKYTMRFGNTLAKAIDVDLLGTTGSCAHTVVTAVTTVGIAQTMITKGRYWLDYADAPTEDRFMVVEAAGYEDLLNIDNFIRYDAKGSSAIENGKVGRCFGFEVLQTNNVPTASNIASAMFFQKSALALALQKDTTMKAVYDIDNLGWKLAAYNIYGLTMQRTDHAVYFAYGVG